MKKIILIFALSIFCMKTMAQTGSLKGTVLFEGLPQELVNVYIAQSTIVTTTDADGKFVLHNIPVGKQKVVVSFVGFRTKIKQVTIYNQKTTHIKFDLEEDTSLEEIVISGTLKPVSKLDSPVPVEVFSPAFFIKNPTPSVFESMANVNGVRPQINCSVCNTGDIHINGLEGPYSFVMIDGMPIVSGLSTVYGLTGIPQSLVERVEIVKGPASTLYGSEAVGGIINVITKTFQRASDFSIETYATDWQEYNIDLGAKYTIGKTVDGLVGINYFNYQHPIDNNNDGFTDLTLQHRISLFNKFNVRRDSGKLFSFAGRYMYEDRWGGQMNFEKKYRGGNEVYGESIYTSRWETFGTYELPTEENITFQFSANGHQQHSFYGTTPFHANQHIGFGQLLWNKTLSSHDVLIGTAYRYTYYNDDTFATKTDNGKADQASITHLPSIFIQDEITLAPQNKLLLGIRYDYHNKHQSIVSPRLNYKWNSDDNKDVIRISLGNGFRVANIFTEDHAALTGARQVVFEGALKPETSWNSNINYTKTITTENNAVITLDASAFYTYFTNKIIPDYETDPKKIIFKNVEGNAVSKGLSFNANCNWYNGLSIIAGATLMDVSTTENGETVRQLLTERFSGTWNLSYTFKKLHLTADYTGNIYGPMDLPLLGKDDPRSPSSPWYSIQNIQLTKKFNNGLEIFGGVKNLLNFTPAANSILNADNPFEKNVDVEANPYLAFDPSYVYASNQGIRTFLGLRYYL